MKITTNKYQSEYRSFRKYLNGRVNENSIATYMSCLRYYFTWLEGQAIPYIDASNNDVTAYSDELTNLGRNKEYIKQIVKVIKCFYDDLKHKGKINHNPATKVILEKRTKTVYVSRIDYDKVLDLYNNFMPGDTDIYLVRAKVLQGLVLFQGVQTAELKQMRISDIDFRKGLVHIPSASRSLERTLKINPQQHYYLMQYCQQIRPQLLKVNKKNKEMLLLSSGGSSNLQNLLDKEIKRFNQLFKTKTNWIELRGAVICSWLESGIDLFEVMRMAGHRHVDSTEYYLKAAGRKEFQKELDMLYPINRPEGIY